MTKTGTLFTSSHANDACFENGHSGRAPAPIEAGKSIVSVTVSEQIELPLEGK